MTFTFKLARRIARLRAPLAAAAILAFAGCASDEGFGPEQPAVLDPTAAPTASSAFAGGIPFGYFGQPTEAYGSVFNGASRIILSQYVMKELASIKARGGKVALKLAGGDKHFKDGNGSFSLTKWKARVDQFKNLDLTPYINDGTIIGHYLVDEPNDPANWNGRPIPPSVLEEMARYSKVHWPDMATIVRTEPDYLDKSHRYLDAAWAQYLNRKGTPQDFLRHNVAAAQDRGLALVVGLNVLHGGTPTGTAMTPSEVVSWGSALLSSTYPCAFISWTYDERYLKSSGVMSAMSDLRRLTQNRSARSCRRGGAAGGETPPPEPPPSEPPPSEPPPSEPPPSAGVPFGPYGLPTAEMDAFSGSLRTVSPTSVLGAVKAARAAGSRVVLRLAVSGVTERDGSFSLTKWKAAVDRYASVDLSSFVSDGTIAGHLLVQDPQSARKWGGRRIPHATLEEMARYSRERWPALPTLVHAPADWLAGKSGGWRYLDAASVMYQGSAGEASTWVGKQASAAGRAGLGLLVGMNVLNGGTSASKLAGGSEGKYAMSASQLRNWGSDLLVPAPVCGLVLNRYDKDYFSRSDVKDALRALGQQAGARAATSCRSRS